MAKHQFQTEVSKLLSLMINSIYSNKDIFLRELISNASDAIDKYKYLTLTDEKFKNEAFNPEIKIKANEKANILIIEDNGIGMNEEDLVEHLGTIAKSGTKAFLESLSGDIKKDSNLIGQFGVGFYSAFMVADKIEVISKKAGEDKAYRWVSEAGDTYEIEEAKRDSQGTTIILHIKEEDKEYLQEYKIKEIVKKYSNYIPYPIYLEKEENGETKKEQINAAEAIWLKNKSELTEEDYKEFYSTISHSDTEPLFYTHIQTEGVVSYSALLYVPSTPPIDLYRVDYEPGVKLYIKRVLITEDDRELLPVYLRFVRGVIDSEDLPLNISREILQQNVVLAKIKKGVVKHLLKEFAKLAKRDKEKYDKFIKNYARVLKEGVYSDLENREKLLELLRFDTTKRENISLQEYIDNIKDDKKEIYYIIGKDKELLKKSPLLEEYNEKDIEVILFTDDIDEIVFSAVTEYKEYKFVDISKVEDEEVKDEKYEELLNKLKETLKDEVKDVKLTKRLKSSPAVLVFDKNDPEYQMREMLKQMGQLENLPEVKPILEINPENEIIQKLTNSENFELMAKLLLNQTKLYSGMEIKNVSEFADEIGELLKKLS